MAIGASYFGNRIVRHVASDMNDLAERGFTGVLHTFSENDLAYYRDTMGEIVRVSHDSGLEVQMGPWGLGRAFGGEAESQFVGRHPEACQVFDDGRRAGAACLNHPEFRRFVAEWADAALEAGADRVFWDEPHWAMPVHFGASDERWACRCQSCLALFSEQTGESMPTEMSPEVAVFRTSSLVSFLGELVDHVARRAGASTICLLPLTEGPHGVADWEPVAALPGLDTIATDPYWRAFDRPVEGFVTEFSTKVQALAETHSLTPQIWIQGFGLGRDDLADINTAVTCARAAGVDDLWTWGYEACDHMSYLSTDASVEVWEALTSALTGSGR